MKWILLTLAALLGMAAPIAAQALPKVEPLPANAIARLGSTHWRHTGGVAYLAFLADNRTLVSVGSAPDNTIRFWDARTGVEVRRLAQPAKKANHWYEAHTLAAVSPGGKWMAARLDGRQIRLWDMEIGRELDPLELESWPIGLSLTARGHKLAVLDEQDNIHIWDLVSRKRIRTIVQRESQDSARGPTGLVRLSPEGNTVFAESQGAFHRDRIFRLWDVVTGEKVPPEAVALGIEHVVSCEFSPNGKQLALAALRFNRSVRILDVATGATDSGFATELFGSSVFAADGKQLWLHQAGENSVHQLDLATGKVLRRITSDADSAVPVTHALLAISPDNKLLASANSAGKIAVLDLVAGRELTDPWQPEGSVRAVQFTPDGTRLLVRCDDSAVWVWEAATGKRLRRLVVPVNPMDLTISSDGVYAVASSEGTFLLSELATGKFRGHLALPVTRDCRFLFTGDGTTLAVWPGDEKANHWRLYDVPGFKHRATLHLPTGGHQVAWSADGTLVAAPYSTSLLGIWSTDTGKRIATIEVPKKPASLHGVFSPGNRMLALDLDNGTVAIWEVASGKKRLDVISNIGSRADPTPWRDTLTTNPRQPGTHLAFSPDGRLLALGGYDGLLEVWDMMLGQVVAASRGHKEPIHAVAFSPDGRQLATGSADSTVVLWDARSWRSGAAPEIGIR
jgi:WD40 repeat protein